MAHKKAGGSSKNLTDSGPQYLGVKLFEGEKAKTGSIIVRQRGTKILGGRNIGLGKDHTLFALKAGTVTFGDKRKKNFDGTTSKRKIVHVD